MIVQCPQCSTRFRLDSRRLDTRGARVTCSLCNHGFVVRTAEDAKAAAPFDDTSTDAHEPDFTPSDALSSESTEVRTVKAPFGVSPHEAQTRVNAKALNIRDRGQNAGREAAPSSFDDMETNVDPPARMAMSLDEVSAAVSHDLPPARSGPFKMSLEQSPAHEDFLNIDFGQESQRPVQPEQAAMSVEADDVISIDEDEVVVLDEEPTQEAASEVTATGVPQFLGPDPSRANTTVASVPSLFTDSPRLRAAAPPAQLDDHFASVRTSVIQVPSLARPTNQAHFEKAQPLPSTSSGVSTFVGRVDAATLAAATPQSDSESESEPEPDFDLLMSGGLSSEGVYQAPQQATALPANQTFEGHTDVHAMGLGFSKQLAQERRQTRPMEVVTASGNEERTKMAVAPPEITGATRVVRAATTAMLTLVLVTLALLALVRTGQLDIEVLRDPERIVRSDSGALGASGINGVQPLSMRSVIYPTAHGRVLVFTGEVTNTSEQTASNLDVIAEVRSKDNTVVAQGRAPLGAVLSVSELAHLETPEAAERLLVAKAAGTRSIARGERVPYMVVVSPAPRELRSSRHLVHLVQGAQPVPVSAPVPKEPPAPVQVAPTTTPAVTADPDAERDAGEAGRAKLKGKRSKMKRKAREDDETVEADAEQ